MTPEEKELLFKDLCARLPYGVTCQFTWTYCNETTDGEVVIAIENDNIRNIDINFKEVLADYYDKWVDLENCKPYLRPMSSLIGKELDECRATCKHRQEGQSVLDCATPQTIDYLISHHFDYRGLIPMGLALEATKDMYKTE